MAMRWRAALMSLFLFGLFIGAWHLATLGSGPAVSMDPEYAKLVGATASQGKSAMPGPLDVGAKIWEHLKDPFYDRGSNDKGIGIQLAYSIARVMTGYLLAVLVAIPVGFLIGMSPLISRALDPFIQVLKPISPLAWMPLALYTIKDSEPVVDLRDLHLLDLADADQYRVRGRGGAQGMAQRRAHARGRHVAGAPSPSSCRRRRRPSSPACAFPSASPGW